MNRRLAAILFYDVVGFSRAIEKSESATVEALNETYDKIIKPLAQHHNGRTIKSMGDGGLMEFSSAVDAVLFSISMQSAVLMLSYELRLSRYLLPIVMLESSLLVF